MNQNNEINTKTITEEMLKEKYYPGFEVIQNNECKLYADIDIKNENDDLIYNEIYKILKQSEYKKYKIFIGSRFEKNEYKNSFHFIINDSWFHCGLCVKKEIEKLFENNNIIKIDLSVYKKKESRQIFRLPYTIKNNKNDIFFEINRKESRNNNKIITYDEPINYLNYYITLNNHKIKLKEICTENIKPINNNNKISTNKDFCNIISKSELLKILDKILIKYLDNYNDWIKIIWAIAEVSNTNSFNDGLIIANNISKKSKKYKNKTDVEEIYNKHDDNKRIGLGTLLFYTKETNETISCKKGKEMIEIDSINFSENIKNNLLDKHYESFKFPMKGFYYIIESNYLFSDYYISQKHYNNNNIAIYSNNKSLLVHDNDNYFNNTNDMKQFYSDQVINKILDIDFNKYDKNKKHIPYINYKNEMYKEVDKELTLQTNKIIYKDFDSNNNYFLTSVNVNIENLNIISYKDIQHKNITESFANDMILYDNLEINLNNLKSIEILFNRFVFNSLEEVKYIIKTYISKIIKYSLGDLKYIIENENDYIFLEKLPYLEVFYKKDINNVTSVSLEKLIKNKQLINCYNECTFKPYNDDNINFNMWKGIKAVKVDNISDDTLKIINFMKEVWCNNNELHFNYIISWLKNVICKGIKTKKCVVLYSNKQQVGKGIIINWILDYVIGRTHSKQITGIDSLVCRFNQDLMNKILINVDELSSLDRKAYSASFDILKNKITEPYINIEIKGGRKFEYPDYCNYIFTTNHINSIKIEENDKRYVIFEVNDKYVDDQKYFKSLQLNQDTANEFYSYLYQFTEISLYTSINSEIKNDMIELSLTSSQLFLKEIKENNYNINVEIDKDDNKLMKSSVLYSNYISWCNDNNEKNIQNHTRFGKECKKILKFIRKKDSIYYNLIFNY
jgi:hypothetical protein